MPEPIPILEQNARSVIAITPQDGTQATGVRILDNNGNVISEDNGLFIKPISNAINPVDYVTLYLRNAGSNDMGIDGSSSAVTFSAGPPASKNLEVARLMLYMEASGNFTSTGFMNLAALANGVQIIADGTILVNWQDNLDVALDMFDLSNAGTAFSNERRSLTGRWTFIRGTGMEPLLIPDGATFDAVVRDDLSAAGIIYRIKIQGQLVNP